MWWLLACVPDAPDPWVELEPLALESFLPHTSVEVASTGRLLRVEETMLSLYTVADGLRVLDPLYHGSARAQCLDASAFETDHEGRQGSCEAGQVQLQRGFLSSGQRLAGAAVDRETIWLLDGEGALFRANANPQVGNPYDYLRLVEAAQLPAAGLLQVEDGAPWVAAPDGLWAPGAAEPRPYPGDVRDFLRVGGQSYVLTSQGLWRDEELLPVFGQRMVATTGGVMGIDRSRGELWRVGAEGVEVLWKGPDPTGPLSQDPVSEKIYVATADGVQILDGEGGALATAATATLNDIYASANHEILLLSDRSLDVYLDQTALVGADPLQVWVAAFLERPRKEEDDVPCFGDESVAAFLKRAADQAPLLHDLALPTALGLTPESVRRAKSCGQKGRLQRLTEGSRTEVGLLVHSLPAGCTGTCYSEFFASEAATLHELDLVPAWTSGTAPHGDAGLDWASAAVEAGLPPTFLFGGMSLLPTIDHDGDPRAKDPWPWRRSELSAQRHFRSANSLSEDQEGPFTFLPGNTIALFSLKGCPNLFLRECQLLLHGGGQYITEEDIQLLNLLLHRALAARGEDGATWYFHLPDLGQYDYTDGCTEQERRWSGCEAALLQDWSFEVHQRYVLNQLVEPSLPSRLP